MDCYDCGHMRDRHLHFSPGCLGGDTRCGCHAFVSEEDAKKRADLEWETAKKEADEYYAKHPEARARVNASFQRWWDEIKNLPPCECGLDDVTTATCPMHKALAKRLSR